MKLLISGSRNATKTMKTTARAAVLRANELGWEIIVGDAVGIDHEVILACQKHGVPYTVYGITAEPRCIKNVPYVHVQGNYTQRDKIMVLNADNIYCIWNHESPGTKKVYEYAKFTGKPAWIT